MLTLKSRQSGFTFIEIAMASVLFLLIMVGVFRLTGHLTGAIVRDKNKIKANDFAQQLLEEVRGASGAGFETLPIGTSVYDGNQRGFTSFTGKLTIGAIDNTGARDVRVKILGPGVDSDYYLKLVKSNAPLTGGIVTGFVKESIGSGTTHAGQGIPGATVTGIDTNGSLVTVTTASDGGYTLYNLDPTIVQTITAKQVGTKPNVIYSSFVQGYYNKINYDGGIAVTDDRCWSTSVSVTATPGPPVIAPDMYLDPLGSITGKIVDEWEMVNTSNTSFNDYTLSMGLNKINVDALFYYDKAYQWWYVLTDTTTIINTWGVNPYYHNYILPNVIPPKPAATYTFYAEQFYGSNPNILPSAANFKWGYCTKSLSIPEANFTGAPKHATQNVSVKRFGWLTGKVRDGSIVGNPAVSGATVKVYADSYSWQTAVTDLNGDYILYNVFNHDGNPYYNIGATKTGYIMTEKPKATISVLTNTINTCDLLIYPTNWSATATGTVWIDVDGTGPILPRLAFANEVTISADMYDNSPDYASFAPYTPKRTTAKTVAGGTYTLNNIKPCFAPTETRAINFSVGGGVTGNINGYVHETNAAGPLVPGATVTWYFSGMPTPYPTTTSDAGGFFQFIGAQADIGVAKTVYLPPDDPADGVNPVTVDCTVDTSKQQIFMYATKPGYYTGSTVLNLINNGTATKDIVIQKYDSCTITGYVKRSDTNAGVDGITVTCKTATCVTYSGGYYYLYVPVSGTENLTITTNKFYTNPPVNTKGFNNGSATVSGATVGSSFNRNIGVDPFGGA